MNYFTIFIEWIIIESHYFFSGVMNHDSKGFILYSRAFALAYEIQCVTLLDLDICERQNTLDNQISDFIQTITYYNREHVH